MSSIVKHCQAVEELNNYHDEKLHGAFLTICLFYPFLEDG